MEYLRQTQNILNKFKILRKLIKNDRMKSKRCTHANKRTILFAFVLNVLWNIYCWASKSFVKYVYQVEFVIIILHFQIWRFIIIASQTFIQKIYYFH